MIRSMTGYSKVQAEEAGVSLTVSVRCINHRFLDSQVRLPAGLESLEPLARRLHKEHVTRGHVEMTVSLEQPDSAQIQLDRNLLKAYWAAYQTLRKELGSAAKPDLVALLRIPGMVAPGNGELQPSELERGQRLLERATTGALERLNEMRAREGEVLLCDLRARLARLKALSEEIGRLAERVPQFYQYRLEGRIRELLSDIEIDAGRLAQEVAYLASRSDITEELTRFRSHLDQAIRLLEENSEAGKKLDFLLQEMNREANTL